MRGSADPHHGIEPRSRAVAPAPISAVRAPAIGHQWVYQVRNLYNGRIVDEITETVTATAPVVRLARSSRAYGALVDEIHAPWGWIRQDPRWSYPVTFTKPLPAWPERFGPRLSASYDDLYQLLGDPNFSAVWNLTMTPVARETITVPAGPFTALHCDSRINYESDDPAVVQSERTESAWLAPEVGRWVLRRSRGTYFLAGRGSDLHEDYFQWELTSWR